MSQPNNVWNRGGKQGNSSTSRTPQNRSSTASPIQPNPQQAPKQENNSRSQTPANNAWGAQRGSVASGSSSNGANVSEQANVAANGFNSAEVKQFLSRGPIPASYKPQASGGGAPWAGAVQAHLMSTGQAFFPHLNKQIQAHENGGGG
ncbi:uncharacterized protein RCC_06432 [Ramularia collo-cygni]|uniref:Uncharacterized protein n=1 Tax=Ramularia collo-cygni TaxID=112498 RepID=A0A2D3VCT4_9PEZI|nr:uncharacterized protein RCC_06432 [Ramularia collo-cygni]CZT20574.1 uncharacterized protein RCC_06432 [Ramularia collo-cygni]